MKNVFWTVLFLIIFFPVGLYLMWKHRHFTEITRVIISLIFFFPVGLYFMWRYRHFTRPVRIGVTVFFAIITMVSCATDNSTQTTPVTKEVKQIKEEPKVTDSKEAEVKPITYNVAGISFEKPSNLVSAIITEVTDGDTFKAKVNGKDEKVRLILVDTPETVHPSKPVEPFGPEASDFTKQQLNGKTVELEIGTQERDQYGRLLAYVWLDNKLYNAMLLEKGFARVAVFPPNTKYVDQFKKVQEGARTGKVGIWSIENYVTDNGFNDAAAKPKEQPAPASTPQSEKKPAAQTTVYYKNCTDARNAGVTPIKQGQPGYDKHLDRDGDGVACEDSDFDSSPSPQTKAQPAPAPKATPQPAPKAEPAPQPKQSDVYYKNCTAVREAGAAPIHRGDPGYDSHLDRDGDGVACE